MTIKAGDRVLLTKDWVDIVPSPIDPVKGTKFQCVGTVSQSHMKARGLVVVYWDNGLNSVQFVPSLEKVDDTKKHNCISIW